MVWKTTNNQINGQQGWEEACFPSSVLSNGGGRVSYKLFNIFYYIHPKIKGTNLGIYNVPFCPALFTTSLQFCIIIYVYDSIGDFYWLNFVTVVSLFA